MVAAGEGFVPNRNSSFSGVCLDALTRGRQHQPTEGVNASVKGSQENLRLETPVISGPGICLGPCAHCEVGLENLFHEDSFSAPLHFWVYPRKESEILLVPSGSQRALALLSPLLLGSPGAWF